MTHVTPTGLAEEAYEAGVNRRADKAMKAGPAGVMIPPTRQAYRKAHDGKLLQQIVRVSAASYRRGILTPERRIEVTESLHADLCRRYPAAEMAVLERYGFASPREFVIVQILAGDFEPSEQVSIPETVLPQGAMNFVADLGGRGSTTAAPVPPDTLDYFRDLVSVRAETSRSFAAASAWPGIFKAQSGRWPRWAELEQQFPLIGEWMRGQRQ